MAYPPCRAVLFAKAGLVAWNAIKAGVITFTSINTVNNIAMPLKYLYNNNKWTIFVHAPSDIPKLLEQGVIIVKNFYTEIDGITITFNDIGKTDDGMEYIRIYFEKPVEGGFHFLESTLPSLNIVEAEGFSEQEQKELLDYASRNAFIIWELAREGGMGVA